MRVLSSTQVKTPEGLSTDLSVYSLLISILSCELQSCHTPELPTPFLSSWPLPSSAWAPPPCMALWKRSPGQNLGNCREPLVCFQFFRNCFLHCLMSNI